jgi:hypothetical protein
MDPKSKFGDPWVPRLPSLGISMKKGHTRIQWVSQLMHGDRREWDEATLRSCFLHTTMLKSAKSDYQIELRT